MASLAPPQLRVFSGVYILATAFIGVFLFQRAPATAKWSHGRWFKKLGSPDKKELAGEV